jgi:CubicO group peptidase (beta-lactamase class C family)
MMKRLLIAAVIAVVFCTLWATLVVIVALQEAPLATLGDARALMHAARERVKDAGVGNCALALIEDGRIFESYVYSVGDPVDAGTLFQMASVSKWVTSWGIMALVRQGRLELDVPVSRYLTRWQLPSTDFDNDGVTVRRLLSHTAGLTDGLWLFRFLAGDAGAVAGRFADVRDRSYARSRRTRPRRLRAGYTLEVFGRRLHVAAAFG